MYGLMLPQYGSPDPWFPAQSCGFDGSTDYLTRPGGITGVGELASGQWIFSTWVRVSNRSTTQAIFEQRNDSNNFDFIVINTTGQIYHRCKESNNVRWTVTSNALVPLAQWVHICISYNSYYGSTNLDKYKLYINGALDSPTYGDGGIDVTNRSSIGGSRDLYIGYEKGNNDYMAGYMADTRLIWDSSFQTDSSTQLDDFAFSWNGTWWPAVNRFRFAKHAQWLFKTTGTVGDDEYNNYDLTGVGTPTTAVTKYPPLNS